MSEEEDKNTLNNVDNATAYNPPNNESDGDNQSDNSFLINGNENSPPCQLDIGLGTHTDNRRHNNNLNVNGKCRTFMYNCIKFRTLTYFFVYIVQYKYFVFVFNFH